MTVKNYSYDLVSGTRTLVVPANNSPQRVSLHNHHHGSGKDIYVGDVDVTVGTGLHLVAGTEVDILLGASDELYAITADADCNLRVLTVR